MNRPSATPRTVPAGLIRAAEQFGDNDALVDGEVRLSYRELHERVRKLARVFLAEGIEPGDRVAINSPNTHHWVITALAILHAGATLVPINTRFTGTEILDVLRRSDARMLAVSGPFLDKDRLADMRAAAAEEAGTEPGSGPVPGLPRLRSVIRIPVDQFDELPPAPGVLEWKDLDERGAAVALDRVDERAAAVRPDDVSDILYTSGTSGRSKGVISAHRQVLSVADAWADCGELHDGDRYLVINPFFHSFGYKAGILACLLRGTTIVPMAVFDVPQVMELVHRERITVLPGPPTIYQSILDHPRRDEHDLSSLRLAVTGAATVPVVLVERMQQELSFSVVLTAYGLTEAVVATMCRPDDDPVTVATTCGRPAAGFELRIADEKGQSLPPDTVGEVLLRGPNTMLGYCDDQEATSAALDDQGWLHTGDLGRVDERGYLKITDRLKDMYICGGFNVYPAEVEQALARLDGVSESAVVGVSDDRLGEVGKAYVVPGPGHSLSEDDVLSFCKKRLANYKVPRHVEFRTSLPRNASGKILKRLLD
jgi:HIP---CoA ligase